MSFINRDELIRVLKEHHSRFIDGTQLFKQALLDARNSHYQTVVPRDPAVSIRTQVIISKIDFTIKNQFEIWVEFSVPRQEGDVVGTHVYEFDLNGILSLKESYGTIFIDS